MKYRNTYSMIVAGDLDNVKAIMNKHREEMHLSDFHGDNGYVFSVVEDVIGSSELVQELRRCPDVHNVASTWESVPVRL